MDKFSVIITCVGSQLIVGMIEALKNQNDLPIKVIGTDANKNAIGRYFADSFYQVCNGSDPAYPEMMFGIAEKEKVRVIIPCSDEEAVSLSRARKMFEEHGIICAVDKIEIIQALADKYLMLKTLDEHGVSVPSYCSISSLQDLERVAETVSNSSEKFVLKPRVSRGARGVWIVGEYNRLKYLTASMDSERYYISYDEVYRTLKNIKRENFPSLLAMEYLPGDKFNVDILSINGKLLHILPRRRYFPIGSPTQACILEDNKEVINKCKEILKVFNQSYLYDYELAIDINRNPMIFEINPRINGTVAATIGCGVNIVIENVKLALGLPLSDLEVNYGVEMFRYWRELRLIDKNMIGK